MGSATRVDADPRNPSTGLFGPTDATDHTSAPATKHVIVEHALESHSSTCCDLPVIRLVQPPPAYPETRQTRIPTNSSLCPKKGAKG